MKPYSINFQPKLQLIAVCVAKEGTKDFNQFKLWCEVNKVENEIFDNFNDVSPMVLLVDFEPFYSDNQTEVVKGILELYPNILNDFYLYLNEIFGTTINDNKAIFPSMVFDRNFAESLELFLSQDVLEDTDFVPQFQPGLGFGWLFTGRYRKESFSVYGELTTRDYIQSMYLKEFDNSPFFPELIYNKKSIDFGINYTKGVVCAGVIPPKSRNPILTNLPRDVLPKPYSIEALKFFSNNEATSKMVDLFDNPKICLQSEYKSVQKYCPCDYLGSKIGTIEKEILLASFEYCVDDWKMAKESMGMYCMDELVQHRGWTSSPGYPYNRAGCTTSREAYDKYYGLIKYFYNMAQFDWMPTIYNVFCKDEILKKIKVEANDVRTIIAPSLCHQLVAQHCTLAIADQVGKQHILSHTQIGRTRFRGDVHRMSKRIVRFEIIEEYDISKWDRSIKAVLIKFFWFYCWYVLDSRLMTDFFMLANVFESTIYGHLLHRSGQVVRKAYGIPSGFTLTSYANSWIHTFLVFTMYCDLMPKEERQKCQTSKDLMNHFRTNIDFVCYGDDGLMGYSSSIFGWFNPDQQSTWFKEKFDMILSLDNCKISNKLYLSLNDVNDVEGISFLGDILHLHTDGLVQPVFKMTKVVNAIVLNFGSKKYSPSEQILISICHYIECFFHPKRDVLYQWLLFVIDKYKGLRVDARLVDNDVLDFLGVNGNSLIQEVRQQIGCDKLNEWIYMTFYRFVDT